MFNEFDHVYVNLKNVFFGLIISLSVLPIKLIVGASRIKLL